MSKSAASTKISSKSAKKVKVPESAIQREILDFFKLLPDWLVWRNYVGPIIRGNGYMSPNPMAGIPDIMGISPQGKLFVIEVKSSTGKLSPKQIEWKARFERMAVIYITARDLDIVRATLNI